LVAKWRLSKPPELVMPECYNFASLALFEATADDFDRVTFDPIGGSEFKVRDNMAAR
jgi:hypothetical protein